VPALNHQQVLIFAEAMDDDIVNKRPLRIKQRRILRLADS